MTDDHRMSGDDDPRRDIDRAAEDADADVADLFDEQTAPVEPTPPEAGTAAHPIPMPAAEHPTAEPAESPSVEDGTADGTPAHPIPMPSAEHATVESAAAPPEPVPVEPAGPEPAAAAMAADQPLGNGAPAQPIAPMPSPPEHEGSDPTVDEATGGAHTGDEHLLGPAAAGLGAAGTATAARPGARRMGHVAEPEEADSRDWWKVWLRRTGVALLATLVLLTGLAWAWMGGLSNPHPRNVPVGIVQGDRAAAVVLAPDQRRGALQVHVYANPASATKALSRRQIAAILVSDQTAAGIGLNLTVATGAGPGVASAVVTSVNSVANAVNVPLTVEDVYPTSQKDSDGRTPFYIMMVWILGGLIAALLLGLTVGTVPRDLDRLGMRLLALLVFALALGLTAALFAGPVLGIWNQHFFGLWMTGALIVFTAALITSALQSWLGMWGVGLAVLLMVVLGVPGSGGIWAPPLLPGFFRSMHSWIPNGLGVDLIRGIEYFSRSANGWPIIALSLWSIVAIVALVGATMVLGRHARSGVADDGRDEETDLDDDYDNPTEDPAADAAR
jgi:hypothetical protein